MADSRSRFPGVSALLVVTLLLVVVPTLEGQPAFQDAATRTFETPTLEDLGVRVCVSCQGLDPSPDGRFLYGTHWVNTAKHANLLLRVSTAPGHADLRRSDLVLRALGNGRFGRPVVVSPDGTRLAFTATMPGGQPTDQQIWIVDAETGADLQVIRGEGYILAWQADGRGVVMNTPEGLVSVSLVDDARRLLLPRDGGWNYQISPDGRFVAYAFGGRGNQPGIYVAALDGSRRGLVAEGRTSDSPFWAPDGTALIYRSYERDRPELWGVEVAEGRAVSRPRVLLTFGRDASNREGWLQRLIGIAADGSLFVRREGDRSDVYTVEIDPETLELRDEARSVFGGEGPLKTGGTISPDGTFMAFITRPPDPRFRGLQGGRKLAIRNLTTGTDRVLDTPPDHSQPFNESPTWSPDGRYLLFPLHRGQYSGYLVDLVTGEQRWLVEDVPGEIVGLFGWLPAGHTVAFARSRPTETGAMVSVRRHDIATGTERELWQGPVPDFWADGMGGSHLSPDGRYVTFYQESGWADGTSWRTRPRNRALSILDLEAGEIRELYRDTNAVCDPARPSVFPSHQWTRSGGEILVANCLNVPDDWGVNEPDREHTFFAIPVDGGAWRTLGRVSIEPGGWAARPHDDESGGARFFSLHPNSDALTFTGGGFVDEVWMVPDFGEILERWKQAGERAGRPLAESVYLTPTHADVRYGPHERNVLDLYLAESDTPTPLVLYIHGGGFWRGDKRSLPFDEARPLLDAGFSVAAINYRLTDTAPAPAAYLDSARALQFLRHNAAQWNIDPRLVASTGGSAGAATSMWLAFHDDLADPDSADPIARQSTRLTAIAVKNGQSSYDPRFAEQIGIPRPNFERDPSFLAFNGIEPDQVDTPHAYALYERFAPITYVSADDPPALLWYTGANEEVTDSTPTGLIVHHPKLGIALKERLDDLGIECIVQYLDPRTGQQVRHTAELPPVTVVDFIREQFERARAEFGR